MPQSVDILTLIFSERIAASQVNMLRGAFMALFPEEETLVHNHVDDSFRYAYPLIQYKRIDGRAAIVAIGEGSRLLRKLDHSSGLRLRIGNDEPRDFVPAEIRQESADFRTGDEMIRYTLTDWLPLNQHNHRDYCALCGMVGKIMMLEKILVGNILSAAKGLGFFITDKLACQITDLREVRQSMMKGVKMMAFDIEFCANILLPDFIGLGKNVSKGHGVVVRKTMT